MQHRSKHRLMEYYRYVYKNSKAWTGEDISGKKLIVYCEQGFGDIIQFLRYFKAVKATGCHLIAHAPSDLFSIIKGSMFSTIPCLEYGVVDDVLDKDNPVLPEHDYHVLSMDLPFILGCKNIDKSPYITLNTAPDSLPGFDESPKIGIVWETHAELGDHKCCPLEYFKCFNKKLFSLQKHISDRFIGDCTGLELFSNAFNDFACTARAIAALDLVVSIDTSVLHLAGAMGKKTYGILPYVADTRWEYEWYSNMMLFRQFVPGNWQSVFDPLLEQLNKDF